LDTAAGVDHIVDVAVAMEALLVLAPAALAVDYVEIALFCKPINV
jgi:hypothetical protein